VQAARASGSGCGLWTTTSTTRWSASKCGATLSFGQNKKGGKLFPIRKLTADGKPSRKDGTFDAKHRGWSKWRGNVDDDGERAAPPAKGGGI
jgi:hypothetical protein